MPADPEAVRALVPSELALSENSQCLINQYVVDSDDRTSGFEGYSPTYCGADLSGHHTPQGGVPDGTLTGAASTRSTRRSPSPGRCSPSSSSSRATRRTLRPADPLQVTWGFYSPKASFCYPGGEGPPATQP